MWIFNLWWWAGLVNELATGIMASRLFGVAVLWLAVTCSSSSSSAESGYGGTRSAALDALCATGSLPVDRTIRLNESVYNLLANDTACRVKDVQGLKLVGNANLTTIQCVRRPGEITSSFFSFFNMTSLSIENIHFVGCGGVLTRDEDLNYLKNSSFAYFDGGQAAVLLCNHCVNLSLSNVMFSNNTGYSFVGINVQGTSMLDRVQILGQDDVHYSYNDSRCNKPGHEFICSSSGMLIFFADSILSVSPCELVLSNSVFSENSFGNGSVNNSNTWCARNTYEKLIAPWDLQAEYSTLADVGALTIAYTQDNFTASVVVTNSSFTDNHGFCFGAVFVLIHTDSTFSAEHRIQGCHFVDNSPTVIPRHEGKNYFGNDVTVYMQYRRSGRGECLSISDTFFRSPSILGNPSISIIHFPNTQGKWRWGG